ncbi:MAG: ATPase [Gemmatimonadales bacterium]|nr:MAG: ATPase [Gemmatimonadales bacterium]
MNEILFLTPGDSAPGFALTGVRQQTVTAEEAWAAIQQACADQDIGVIVADTRLLKKSDPVRLRELTDRWRGVMVTLPAPAGRRAPPVDELQRLVQRALGYHVRLQQ